MLYVVIHAGYECNDHCIKILHNPLTLYLIVKPFIINVFLNAFYSRTLYFMQCIPKYTFKCKRQKLNKCILHYEYARRSSGFFVRLFWGRGEGHWGGGGHTKKKNILKRKKRHLLYTYTNLMKIEMFVSQNKIYILGNCNQTT